MNCMFCDKSVFGNNGLPVPGQGPAHQNCYQAHEALRRAFQHLNISALNDGELIDLKDLVLAEENNRQRTDDTNDVELF